ncbi:autotransporter domain-containing protein [Endozoicomonas sp. ALC013]|uniref:autotransporter domain-containing protein n=1 Tax=Endozoicomonas sp. ALC013 TaxID=3403076 RepID=UPI003BB4C0F7
MSRMSITSGKKALVLAISSVLAGWVGSNGSYADGLDDWPPKQAVPISGNEEKTVPAGIITIKDTCDGGSSQSACNISMTGGTLTIPSNATIKVEGTGDASIVSKTGNNTITNEGKVSVVKDATGVRLKADKLTIGGGGEIDAFSGADDTTGVVIEGGELTNSSTVKGSNSKAAIKIEGGTLINSGSIESSAAAIEITGAATATFNTGSTVKGLHASAVAIDASAATGKVTVNINEGTFTGDIKGNAGKDNELNIKKTGDGIKNNISGFETINITGTGWTAQGHVSGANKLNTNSAIEDLYVSKKDSDLVTSADPDTLRIKMASETLAIETDTASGADSKVKNLHILDATHLNLSDGNSSSPGPATVDTITVGGTAGWQVDGVAKGVTEVNTTGTVGKLYVDDKEASELSSIQSAAGLLKVGSENLKITTNSPGTIEHLHILGAKQLTFGETSSGSASVGQINVGPTAAWTTAGKAENVSVVKTTGTIENLYIIENETPVSAAGSLWVKSKSDGLTIATNISGGAEGKISNLHILSAKNKLTLSDDEANYQSGFATVDKIIVGEEVGKPDGDNLDVDGFASGVTKLNTVGIINLNVYDKNPETSGGSNGSDTLKVISEKLAIVTDIAKNPNSKIENLHILGATQLNLSDSVNEFGPAAVEQITVGDTAGWQVNGLAKGVSAVNTRSTINNLYVRGNAAVPSAITDKEKDNTVGSLQVMSDQLAIVTDTASGAEGKINDLHILGATKLTGTAPAIENIQVYSAEDWKLLPVLSGVKNITAKMPASASGASSVPTFISAISLRSDATNLNDSDAKTLSIKALKSDTNHPNITADKLGLIEKLTIGKEAGIGDISNVKNIEIATASADPDWQVGLVNNASEITVTNSTVNNLSVNVSGANVPVGNQRSAVGSLQVRSDALKIATTGSGKIDNLHILGGTELQGSGPVAIKNLEVNSADSWKLLPYLSGVEKITAKMPASASGASSVPTVISAISLVGANAKDLTKDAKTLSIVAPKSPATSPQVTADKLGLIEKLTIGKAAGIGDISNVKNIEINSATTDWQAGLVKNASKITATSTIEHLHVDDSKAKELSAIDKADGRLKAGSDNLTIVANASDKSASKINNLHIHGAAQLNISDGKDQPGPASVDKIIVGKTDGWKVRGLAKASNVETTGTIKHLYVGTQDHKLSASAIEDTASLRVVQSGELNIKTDKNGDADGKIDKLHILGGTTLKGTDLVINNIEVNSTDDWKLLSALSGMKSITAKKPASGEDSGNQEVISAITLQGSGATKPPENVSKTLNINTPNSIQISADESGLIKTLTIGDAAAAGTISNVKQIKINSPNSDWQVGLLKNPSLITVDDAVKANSITIKGPGSPASRASSGSTKGVLNVAFDQPADDFFHITGGDAIAKIDFANTSERPSLKFTPTKSMTFDNINGHPSKQDTLVFTGDVGFSDDKNKMPAGFFGIEYRYMPDSVPANLKMLELSSIDQYSTIKAVKKGSEDSDGALNIPFATASMPTAFYLKTADDTHYSIDFSSTDRPTTTFEIAKGLVTELKNDSSKNDQLVIRGGILEGDIDSISSLAIAGGEADAGDWTASGTFSNLNSVNVLDKGVLTALNVAGPSKSEQRSAPGQTLNVTTASGQPLPVTVSKGGQLNTLKINDGASLAAVKLQGATTINIDENAKNWNVGSVTDAGAIQAPTHEFTQVKLGKDLTTGPVNQQNLVLNTLSHPVSITAKGIKTLELASGARLGNADGVKQLNITGTDWSAKEWLPGVSTVQTSSAISDLSVTNKPAPAGDVQGNAAESLNSLKVESDKLAIATDANGKIDHLQILGATELSLSSGVNKFGPAVVDKITVGKDATGWKVTGYASTVSAVNTKSTVNNLYVRDGNAAIPSAIQDKDIATGSLQVMSKELAIATDTVGAQGKIGNLHILGASQLNLSDGVNKLGLAAVDKITVGDIAGWQVNGLAKGVSALTTDGTVNHLYVSDSNAVVINAITDKDNAAGSLQVMSDELAITTTKTGAAAGKIDQLHILGGTKLTVSAPVINNIEVNSADDWELRSAMSGVQSITAKKPASGNQTVISGISLVGADAEKPGQPKTLNINAKSDNPIQISADESGLIEKLTIDKAAVVGTITNVKNIDIKSNDWQMGLVTDVDRIQAESLKSVRVGKALKADLVKQQSLVLNTQSRPVSLTTAQGIDTLELAKGARLTTADAVHHLKITDNDWSATGAVTMVGDKASIDIMEGISVGAIGTIATIGKDVQVAAKKADAVAPPSSLKIAFNPTESKTLKVTSSGNIKGNIDFTGVSENATVTLEQTGGMIEGNITGVSDIMISGTDELKGSIKGKVKLDIVKGGKLKIHETVNDGGDLYHQVGDLEMGPGTNPDRPVVVADRIEIEPDAKVVVDLKEVQIKDKEELMISKAPIKRAVTLDVKNEQYEHFTAMLDSKDNKRMVVAREPMVNHVRKLATAGGAPASAVRALEVAANKKVAVSESDDNLNKFVVPLAKTSDQAAQLARQLTPDNTASAVSAAQGAQRMSGKAIETRTTSIRTGISSGDMMESGGFWIQYAYNDATQDEHDGVFGFDAKTNGFTLGVDTELDDMTDVGLAYTYAKTDISGKGSGGSMDSKNHIFSLYGAFTQDEMFLDGQLSYSSGDNDARRSVVGNAVKASYDTKSWGISLTAGYTMPMDDDWSWQPLGAFNYYRIETDDYSESAALNHLAYDNVKNDNYSILELGVGVKLMGDIYMDDMVFQPAFKLMAFHDFKDDPVTMTAHYAAGGDSFVVHGAKRDDNRFQFAASVDMELDSNMTLSFNYSHDWMDNFKSDGFIARLRYDF